MAGKTTGYALAGIVIAVAGILIGVGALYLCAASAPGVDAGSRLTVAAGLLIAGLILMGVGVVVIWVVRTRGPRPIQQVTQQLELDMAGEISVEKLKCESCGAELSKDNVTLAQGAVIISCPYCNSTYQITEEPKW